MGKHKFWSEQDDYKLWSLRSKPPSQLASTFNRTPGAIRSRLKHLNDPTHKAYQRRIKNHIAVGIVSTNNVHQHQQLQ